MSVIRKRKSPEATLSWEYKEEKRRRKGRIPAQQFVQARNNVNTVNVHYFYSLFDS